MDDPTNRNVVMLGRLIQEHRETAGKDDERFLLFAVDVTSAPCPELVSPDIRAAVLKVSCRLKLRYVSSGFPGFVWARDPLKLFLPDD